MNPATIFHRPLSEYAFALDDTHYVFRLRTGKGEAHSCKFYYADRAIMTPELEFFCVPMEKFREDQYFDWYEIRLETSFERIAYYFELFDGAESLCYYGDCYEMIGKPNRADYFQLPFNHRADRLTIPEWTKDAIVYNIFPDSFADPHMFEIISGITTYLDDKDYSLMLKPLSKQAAPMYIRDIIQQRSADALIIHAHILSTELAAILSRVDFPYLVIGKPGFRCNVCWIDVNHEQAGQLAANYLLDKGYRRMALIMGQEDDALSQSRLTGIKQAMAEEELTIEVVCNESPYALDDEVLDNLLIPQSRPEVLLCSNNHLALHCLQHIRRLGLKIPENIALLTFDNYPFSMLTDPMITAVEVDMHDMGVNAARFVLQRIRKPSLRTQSYCTSPCILEREST